jgi:hypothetical protein
MVENSGERGGNRTFNLLIFDQQPTINGFNGFPNDFVVTSRQVQARLFPSVFPRHRPQMRHAGAPLLPQLVPVRSVRVFRYYAPRRDVRSQTRSINRFANVREPSARSQGQWQRRTIAHVSLGQQLCSSLDKLFNDLKIFFFFLCAERATLRSWHQRQVVSSPNLPLASMAMKELVQRTVLWNDTSFSSVDADK